MSKNYFKYNKAFTLAELLIALLILTVSAGMFLLNIKDFYKIDSKHEADRLMRWFYNIMQRSDHTGEKFSLTISISFDDHILIEWNKSLKSEFLYASKGCQFRNRGFNPMIYAPQWGTLTPGLTLEIKDYKNNLYYLIISGQGQIRISDSPAN
ncbi:MAG: prepilin-type N-terminal cleavage/methylation domain-containing protein [Synergistaceae bacterium]|nr:prepilin-type N-terminal cleavage/methylation domain-containing protein [Synergistaceae bacterium]